MMDTSGLDDLIRQMNRMGQITGPAAREMVEQRTRCGEEPVSTQENQKIEKNREKRRKKEKK